MKTSLGKAALLALSMMPVTVFASHWSYEGEGSPEHWGALNEEYKTCQNGMNQSPINIDATFKTHLSPLDTHYIDGPITLINNGHTIQAALRPRQRTPLRLTVRHLSSSSSISMPRAKTRSTASTMRWRCIWYIRTLKAPSPWWR